MDKEFVELYNNWYYSFALSAVFNPINEKFVLLEKWCINNKEKAIEYIKEILLESPDEIILILPTLTCKEFNLGTNGLYFKLPDLCNLWLNYLIKSDEPIDYYKDWRKWKKHLDKNYIYWRPNLEDDPNVTLEEFKQGKRNNLKKFKHKWHEFPLSILTDKELKELSDNGHIGDMTKYIEELSFFYNRVKEEIKRRELKNGRLYY